MHALRSTLTRANPTTAHLSTTVRRLSCPLVAVGGTFQKICSLWPYAPSHSIRHASRTHYSMYILALSNIGLVLEWLAPLTVSTPQKTLPKSCRQSSPQMVIFRAPLTNNERRYCVLRTVPARRIPFVEMIVSVTHPLLLSCFYFSLLPISSLNPENPPPYGVFIVLTRIEFDCAYLLSVAGSLDRLCRVKGLYVDLPRI